MNMRRALASILLIVITAGTAVGALAVPRAARAIPVEDIPMFGLETGSKIVDKIIKGLIGSGTVAIVNAADYFMRKIAYDTAVFVASGGKGKHPLFERRSIGNYLQDTALGAAGEALGTLTEKGFLGFNFCDPSGPNAPRIKISLLLGIANFHAPQPPKPKCEWSKVSANWKELAQTYESGEALRQASFSIEPGQSELSVAFQTNIKVAEDAATKAQLSLEQYRIGKGFKALEEKVTSRAKTPSVVVEETFKENLVAGPKSSEAEKREALGKALQEGALAVIPAAISTFLNTLSAQLLQKILSQGVFPDKNTACAGLDGFNKAVSALGADRLSVGTLGACKSNKLQNPELAFGEGEGDARLAFADLLTPSIQESNRYDAITEFTVCPAAYRTPTNCVMDEQFASAARLAQVDRPITVREAIAQGYLHGDWPLVSNRESDKGRNQDPYCYTNAYCYSNLVKLRKARIISVGWEIAASKSWPNDRRPTLQQVVDGFSKCPAPGAAEDETTAWCHLIDPNWVLKYPATQCRALVHGPTLLAGEADLRAQVCADSPSCIAEDEKGKCVGGYGYCVAEKNVWQIGGAACASEYATCRSFTKRGGELFSLLLNTADTAACTPENAGCRGYSASHTAATDAGVGDWVSPADRVFLTKNAEVCTAQDAGCRELYPKSARRNLILNSGFEQDTDANGAADLWSGAALARSNDPGVATGSAYAVRPNRRGSGLGQSFDLEPGSAYSFSFFARRNAAADAGASIRGQLLLKNASGFPIVAAGTDTNCTVSGSSLLLTVAPRDAASYTFGSCRFVAPFAAARADLELYHNAPDDAQSAWVDAVQIEEGPRATAYHESAFVGASPAYFRAPPAWLGCRGDDDDPSECLSYAAICRPDEVGCEKYNPRDGSPVVPGIITAADSCPSACVGYAAYRQEPSRFDVESFPLYLIPRTGRQCSAAAAGCAEFTNVEAGGGEARSYFSDIRACVKPDAADVRQQTFYTWEGSEARGYQLKEWQLLAAADGAPALSDPAAADRCTREIFLRGPQEAGHNPDCREFFNSAGVPSYRLYSKTIVVTAECTEYRMTEVPGDAARRAETCAARGGAFNRETGNCTVFSYPRESRSCAAADNGCRLYTGNAGRNVRILFTDTFEGAGDNQWLSSVAAGFEITSESVNVGGHSLAVPAGAEITTSVTSTSRAALQKGGVYFLSFWAKGRGSIGASFPTMGVSLGSVTVSDVWKRHELGPVQVASDPESNEALSLQGFSDRTFLDNIELKQVASAVALIKNSWRTPAACDETNAGTPLPQAQLGCAEYQTSAGAGVTLKSFSSLCRERVAGCRAYTDTQVSDSPGRETWNALCALASPAVAPTPCATAPGGPTRCTVGIGRQTCRYHTVGDAPRVACPGAAVSCTLDGILIRNGQPIDLSAVPADKTRYLVPTQAVLCAPEKAGCSQVGLPTAATCALAGACASASGCACAESPGGPALCTVAHRETACRYALPWREPLPASPLAAAAGTSLLYKDSFVRNAPRAYDRTLCTVEANGCEEFEAAGGNGFSYLKDPGDRICEYRERVTVAGAITSGWFKKGTQTACDPTYLVSGNLFGIRRNGDPEFAGFAGACRPDANGCVEFIDPADTKQPYPAGHPYYVIKGEEVKRNIAACAGKASQKEGCILFNDTSSPARLWNAAATDQASKEKDYTAVEPVSCPEGEQCKQCRYSNLLLPGGGGTLLYRFGETCAADADCQAADSFYRVARCEHPESRQALEARGIRVTNDPVVLANNANTAMKVRQDRQCGQWLTCRGAAPVWDERAGKVKEVCDSIGLCDQFVAAGQTTQCAHWVDDADPKILSEKTYRERNTGAGGLDFSGYAIPGNYGVDQLTQIPIKTCRLQPQLACSSDADCARGGFEDYAGHCALNAYRLARVVGPCKDKNGAPVPDGAACEPEEGDKGMCINKKCVQDMKGDLTSGASRPFAVAAAETPSCRAYPEQNSPFPSAVATFDEFGKIQNALPGFQNAKVCQPGTGQDCECSYKKATYGSGNVIKYFSRLTFESKIPLGICQGGLFDGQSCDPEADGGRLPGMPNGSCKPYVGGKILADQSGTCQGRTREDLFEGLRGYCLERDAAVTINGDPNTHACLTWLPTDRLAGSQDVYNSYAKAGFPQTNAFVCAVPELTKTVATARNKCVRIGCQSHEPFFGMYTAFDRPTCATGYFLVMGACKSNTSYENFDGCPKGGKGSYPVPYRCVPIGSTHIGGKNDPDEGDNGLSCDPDTDPALVRVPKTGTFVLPDGRRSTGDVTAAMANLAQKSGGEVPVYFAQDSTWDTTSDTDNFKKYDDCVLRGVPYSQSNFKSENAIYQLSCSVAVQVAKETVGAEESNKAWTNRLWSGGSYRLQAPEAPTYGVTCQLPAVCDQRGGCPCEVKGLGTCVVDNGQPSCNVTVNPLRYSAKTPPRAEPLYTFGQTIFKSNDPTTESDVARISMCKDTTSAFNVQLPLPESADCPAGFTKAGVNRSRPYMGVKLKLLVSSYCERDAGCSSNVGVTCAFAPGVNRGDELPDEGTCSNDPDGDGVFAKCSEDSDCYAERCEGFVEGSLTAGVLAGAAAGGAAGGFAGAAVGGVIGGLLAGGEQGQCVPRADTRLQPVVEGNMPVVLGRMHQLFGRFYKVWKWQYPVSTPAITFTPGAYQEVNPHPTIPADDRAGTSGKSPKIIAVGRCDAAGRCEEGPEGKITIDNTFNADIRAGGGVKFAVLKFFAAADDNQMPIKSVTVDWGDGTVQGPFPGLYKNHRGWIIAGAAPVSLCDGSGFGSSKDACDDSAPFTFTHSYTCAGPAPCAFKPKVQVKDNWGFCNGVCGGAASPGGTRCYEDIPINECDIGNNQPWTSFSKQIILAPRQ